MLSYKITISLVAALASLAAASPIEPELQARQGTLGSAFAAFLKVILNDAIEGDQPVCAQDFGNEGEQYLIGIGQDHNGNFYEVCWQNDTDTTLWDQATADVANCLTNLHYTQASTCISVEGSSCDNGYVSGGGRLQNLRESNVLGSGSQSSSQISADQSVTYQAAWNSLVGFNVKGLNAKGPYAYQVTDESGTKMDGSIEMQANFKGETAC